MPGSIAAVFYQPIVLAALQTGPLALRRSWMSDFGIRAGRVTVFETGADLKLDSKLLGEVCVWLGFHAVVRLRAAALCLIGRRGPRLWFTPTQPRPWYLIWSAATWGGMRMARSAQDADAVFAFEDATWTTVTPPPLRPAFNFSCDDVSKSRVAAVFENVFGYPLTIDPLTWTGPAVEKGEINGRHDGRLVVCPTKPVAGRCYQRLIDTSDGRFAYDLRTPVVGGRLVGVWIKRRPLADRFSIHNLGVELRRPQDVFTANEIILIGRFAAAMGADWAGLDILRDRDGRIYIVDVNKTDVGPIIALSWRDKLRSTRLLADALAAMVAVRPSSSLR